MGGRCDPNVSDKEARAAANCMVLHPACHDDPVEFYNLHGFSRTISEGSREKSRRKRQRALRAECPLSQGAKRFFAGLTRGGRNYQNPRRSGAAIDGFVQAGSMPFDADQPADETSRAIAALKPAILGAGPLPDAARCGSPRWRREPPWSGFRQT
jgi:hypothetical protein